MSNVDTVLIALRKEVESQGNRPGFGTVYLDNAIPKGMSRHVFAGCLSALEKSGLYVSYNDGCFGEVKLS